MSKPFVALADFALPIDPVLSRLDAALAQGHAVLAAPTSSGKTTRLPLALLGLAYPNRIKAMEEATH